MAKCRESLLIYGASGSGKTTQLSMLAEWCMLRYGKKTRLISTSGGGWSSIIPAVESGIVEATYICDRAHAFETLDRFSKGWWPADLEDPQSPLIPPTGQQDWDKIGCICFDSITEAASWLMDDMVYREARGEFKSSSQNLMVRFRDGDTWIGSPAPGHYGTIQNNIARYIVQMKSIPKYVACTALELKTSDMRTQLPMYGPDVIGQKMTQTVSAMFENTLHLYFVETKDPNRPTRRMYLSTHFEEGVPFVAKNRGDYRAPLPEYLEGDSMNVGAFLDSLEESRKKALAIFAGQLKNFQPQPSTHTEVTK